MAIASNVCAWVSHNKKDNRQNNINKPAKRVIKGTKIASFIAGIGGGLYVALIGFVKPEQASFNNSINYLIYVVLGGMGSTTGAILSAFVLTILQELLRFLRDYRLLIYPLILICMMLFRPQGLLGTAELCFFKIPDYFKAIGRWFKKIFSKKSKEAE